jgi:hemerythrin-like domain-containing protein
MLGSDNLEVIDLLVKEHLSEEVLKEVNEKSKKIEEEAAKKDIQEKYTRLLNDLEAKIS